MNYQFKELPSTPKSIVSRKPICGVGINDACYEVYNIKCGKRVVCHYYRSWKNMINRCYSKKLQEKYPTYIECSVCNEWLLFSNFKLWMINQNWESKELDKDVIEPGNKIYSPGTCCFIDKSLNLLLADNESIRGDCPKGVNFHKRDRVYQARVSQGGKSKYLGYYLTPEDASRAYIKEKVKIILKAALEQCDERVATGLKAHAKLLSIKLVGVDHEHST